MSRSNGRGVHPRVGSTTPAGPLDAAVGRSGSDLQESLLPRLRALASSLPPQLQRATAYVLEHPDRVLRQALAETAEAAGVGEATVVRLCQEAGCRGLQDLKLALARELVRAEARVHEDVSPHDTLETVARKVFAGEIEALEATLASLDWTAMERAVSLLLGARQILFFGVGTSAPIVEDAYLRFARIRLPCAVHPDSMTQAMLAALAGPGTVVVAVSHSGSTRETVETLALARRAGAAAIALTGSRRSPIAKHADIVLHTAARETMFRTEAAASRLAALAIVDALYVGVALRRFDASTEALARYEQVLARRRY